MTIKTITYKLFPTSSLFASCFLVSISCSRYYVLETPGSAHQNGPGAWRGQTKHLSAIYDVFRPCGAGAAGREEGGLDHRDGP